MMPTPESILAESVPVSPAGGTPSPRRRLSRLGPTAACITLVVVGTILRLRQYAFGRSLWVDEASLANNLIARTFSELLGQLDSNQAAPPGFLLASKTVVLLLGNTEYALRLIPLLAGILSLVLFYFLARRYLAPWTVAGALGLMVFGAQMNRYANEFKQYSTDVLATLLILLLAERFFTRRLSPWLFALLGVLVPWCSHPSVFVLAGVGSCYLLCYWRDRRWRDARTLAFCGVAWLASFGVLYTVSMAPIRDNPYFAQSALWSNGYLPLPWYSPPAREWLWATYQGFIDLAWHSRAGNPAVAQGVGALLALSVPFALVRFRRTQRRPLAILFLPVLFGLVAAVLRIYPFMHRLILFLTPMSILLVTVGLDAMGLRHRKLPVVLKWLTWGALLYLPAAAQWNGLLIPAQAEELRSLVEQLQRQRQPGDVVYVYYGAWEATRYYLQRQGATLDGLIHGSVVRDDLGLSRQDLAPLVGTSRVWVVFSHEVPRERRYIVHHLETLGRCLSTETRVGARIHLFDLSVAPTNGIAVAAPAG